MLRTRQKKAIVNLPIAPIIDIVFILLIFFAVSSSLVSKNQGIPLDLPHVVSSEKQETGITISIDKDKHFFIDKDAVTFDTLLISLKSRIKETPDLSVILNADNSLNYDVIIQTLDIIRQAGCHSISLQVEKHIPTP